MNTLNCHFCKTELSKNKYNNHLVDCINKHQTNRTTDSFLIYIKSDNYWLFIMIPLDYSLFDLYYFLKNKWLNCCDIGHASNFMINKILYTNYEGNTDSEGNVNSDSSSELLNSDSELISDTDSELSHSSQEEESNKRKKNIKQKVSNVVINSVSSFGTKELTYSYKLKDILNVHDKFIFEYDVHETTILKFNILSVIKKSGAGIDLIAQNNNFTEKCEKCNLCASQVCVTCVEYFCDMCAVNLEHECVIDDNNIMSFILNSPRCGHCEYGKIDD